MIVTAHQPTFLPYLGIVRKIIDSDYLVLLDDVQYVRRGFVNRNKIFTRDGEKWITVPVVKADRNAKINEIRIDYSTNWNEKMLSTIKHTYGNAPYYDEVSPLMNDLLRTHYDLLVDLNIHTLKTLCKYLGIDTKMVCSSEYQLSDDPTERLVDAVNVLGGSTYLSGKNGIEYLDLSKFGSVHVEFQNYECKKYPQFNNRGGFAPYMSVLDYVMNMGNDTSLI